MQSSIRLIAVDLDGTLLNDSKQVAPETAEALGCLPPDVRLVIASARPPRSVRSIYQSLKLSTLQINYNGALIWDEPQRRAVEHLPMPGSLVRRIVDYARDMFEEVLVTCEVLDTWYTDRDDNTYTTETGKLFRPDVIDSLDVCCGQDITKLMLLGDARMIGRLESDIAQAFDSDVSVLRTDDELIQIMNRRAGKAAALRRVADLYGVSMDQVMAIGDAPNDVGMLEVAAVSVAMGNAHPLAKAAADWIAPNNNDQGVRAALSRFGLCPVGRPS